MNINIKIITDRIKQLEDLAYVEGDSVKTAEIQGELNALETILKAII